MEERVKLEIYLPQEALPVVMAALHQAGAGRLGNYDHVFATSPVQGYFRPLPGSTPHTGAIGQLYEGGEIKLETVCPGKQAHLAVDAVRRVHPYEEPLIHILPLLAEDAPTEETEADDDLSLFSIQV